MKLLNSVLLTAVITLISCSGFAAKETVMYKKVDKDGNITFTDQAIPGSQQITVKTDVNVVTTPKPRVLRPNPDASSANQQKPFKYDVLAIDTPKNDEPVRANNGDINIVAGISPNLRRGHSVQLSMDGSAVGSIQKIPYFNLNNVDRGTHKISISVINDDTQEVIQTSEIISFHVLRASILNN